MGPDPAGGVPSKLYERPGYCPICCGAFLTSWIGFPCPNKCREEYDPLVHRGRHEGYRQRQMVWQVEKGEFRDAVIAAWRLGGVNVACAVVKHWVRGSEFAELTGL